ncbi:MAG: hemerythrin domain-containing protein [Phycisphaerae bacterium]
MSIATITTDHEEIKQWATERNGKPATVKDTANGGPGLLRIEFQDDEDVEGLKRIQWPTFFKKFDEKGLALLYQETRERGRVSRFCKIIYAPQGLLKTLQDQHEAIKSTLEDMASTTSRAEKTRPRLLEKLRSLVIPHMKAEEKTFYKKLKSAADEDQQAHVIEANEEHMHARRALKRLEKADVDDPKWEARCKVLKELIEHHIEEEESEMFDMARTLLEEEGLEEVEPAYEEKYNKTAEKVSS